VTIIVIMVVVVIVIAMVAVAGEYAATQQDTRRYDEKKE